MKGRGAFIVLEGCDRCGKSTQCRRIVELLTKAGKPARLFSFPDRSTKIGGIIDDYLSKKIDLPDKAVHLLFSSNRWELEPEMRRLLASGVTLVVDRYSHSGVAFSAAKPNMDVCWCWHPEVGLPKPDLVLYLSLSADSAGKRGNYGVERYENTHFQQKVAANFQRLREPSWKVIEGDKSIECVTNEIMRYVFKVMDAASNVPIQQFQKL